MRLLLAFLFVSSLAFGQGLPIAASNGLIGYWSFNEQGGAKALDGARNNDGTLTNFSLSGTTSNWRPTPYKGGLAFDGSDDYIPIPTLEPRLSTFYTVAMWFNTTSLAAGQYYLTSDWSGTERNYIIYRDAATINGLVGNGSNLQDATMTTASVSSNTWYHVALVVNRTSHIIYLNGVVAASQTGSHSGGVTSNARNIATVNTANAAFWGGLIDEVRFYNRALTQNEIQQLYQIK